MGSAEARWAWRGGGWGWGWDGFGVGLGTGLLVAGATLSLLRWVLGYGYPAYGCGIVKPIFAPFCGGGLLTPHSCLSKSSQSRLVILESPLVRR